MQSTFDPRVGFRLVKPLLKDSNTYSCLARNNDGLETTYSIHVTVVSKYLDVINNINYNYFHY